MLMTRTPNITNDVMQGMLMGSSNLKYETKTLEIEGLGKTHYGDEGAIMEDDE